MTDSKTDFVYIKHILDAILKIEGYLKGISEHDFKTNSLIQDGLIRQLEIIGEASKNVSQKTKEQCPDIPWKKISGLRDVLTHAYFGITVELIWRILEDEIPLLKEQLKQVK